MQFSAEDMMYDCALRRRSNNVKALIKNNIKMQTSAAGNPFERAIAPLLRVSSQPFAFLAKLSDFRL
jgi:hypothetical protein